MAQNEASINALYEMTWIRAEVVSETVRLETEIILYKRGVDRILNSGFIQSAAVTTDDTWVVHTENGEMSGIRLRATDQPRESAEPYWQGLQFRYAQGHDAGLFTDPVSAWLHRIPVVLHEGLRAELDVPVGAWITLHNTANGAEVRAVVAGAYRSDTEPDVPLSANRTVMVPLAAIDHQSMGAWFIHPATIEAIINIRHQRAWFVAAEFTIDPAFNRELSATARQLTGIVRMRDSGDTERTQMRMLVHDDALRMNAAPMEGVLSLLTVLYPVLLAVSVLIAAGLALLMAMQSTKNAALLRVLGTTKLRVSAILCVEQVAVCIAGLSVGLAAVFVLFDSDMRQLFVNAGLYLGGALIGSAIAAWRITAKKPLELLQVKD
jgi:ABC-type lipoprotein release transport system permease subunit